MDAYLILLFALPIAGLLSAVIVVARNPRDYSVHNHLYAQNHRTRPHL